MFTIRSQKYGDHEGLSASQAAERIFHSQMIQVMFSWTDTFAQMAPGTSMTLIDGLGNKTEIERAA